MVFLSPLLPTVSVVDEVIGLEGQREILLALPSSAPRPHVGPACSVILCQAWTAAEDLSAALVIALPVPHRRLHTSRGTAAWTADARSDHHPAVRL